jgi:hypothetical protein
MEHNTVNRQVFDVDSMYVLVVMMAALLVIVATVFGGNQELLKDIIGLFKSMVG